jgi:hypothetical protein
MYSVQRAMRTYAAEAAARCEKIEIRGTHGKLTGSVRASAG